MSQKQTLDHDRTDSSYRGNVRNHSGEDDGDGRNAGMSQSDEVLSECVNPDVNAASSPPFLNILHLSFNQNSSRFAVGTEQGFRLFTCDPCMELSRREYGLGIGGVEMIFQSNIIALVGGGSEPMYPLNKVMFWNNDDDDDCKCIGHLEFRSEVKSIRLRRDKVVVVLSQKILVYKFSDLKFVHQIETLHNPKGLCEVSQGAGNMVLACLGLMKGQVRIEHYASRRTKFITAHDSSISNFALTVDGRFLATASSKGTLVRVFDTMGGSLLQEVRRGTDTADIYSLAFSSTAEWLAVSSDKNTIHVFRLKVDSGSSGIERSNSMKSSSITSAVSHLPFIKGVLPKYFSSEWSLAQFRLPEGSRYIVAFGHQKNTVVIVGMNGRFYRCQFDPETGGEMQQLEYRNIFNPQEVL